MKRKLICILLCACLLVGVFPALGLQVHAASEMKASDDCIAMLKALEGFAAKPYWDYSQYSVGYGTACPSEEDRLRYEEEGISEEEAEMLLRRYVKTSEDYLNLYLIDEYAITLNQNQFDALILFTYNCGTGWIVDSVSTLRDAIVNGATGNDFLYPISRWCFAGGSVQTFLLDRRMKEANVYLNGVYSTAVPENYTYVRYNANGGKTSSSVQGYDVTDPADPVAVATLEGSTFDGWYTKAEGGSKVTKLNADTREMTLYAHWVGDSSVTEPTEPETPTEPEEPSEPEKPTEPEKPAQSVKIKVTSDYVNVRKGPGTGYAVVSSVNTGKELTVTETASGSGYDWGKFSDGWICLKYTNYDSVVNGDSQPETPAEPEKPDTETQKVTGKVVVDTTLRIRSGPGTSYSIAGYLSNGTRVEILEQTQSGGTVWGKITKGWISMDYVKLDGDTQKPAEEETPTESEKPAEPENPTEPETPAEPEESGDTVIATGKVYNASELRVRSGAGTNYSVVGYLSNGDKVEIFERTTVDGTVWGRISKGWISMDYVKLDGEESTKVIATGQVVDTDSLRIRSGAGTGNSVLGYLSRGTRVEIYEKMTVGSMVWGRIDKGWISLDYVKLDGESSGESSNVKTVNTSSLRIRSGAGTDNAIVGYLTMGDRVEILEEKTVNGTVWGRISNGWISLDYVK